MRNYKRLYIPNATYFFTVNLQHRKSKQLIKNINILRFAFKRVKQIYPFYINAIVIMPNHWHLLMTLPENDIDYPKRIKLIKSYFSMQIAKTENEDISKSRKIKCERGIWQRRYWEHTIRDEIDFDKHFDYIHFNPVKHGFVENPFDWEYSSIHMYKDYYLNNQISNLSDCFNQMKFGE